jgi:hypothetical protein
MRGGLLGREGGMGLGRGRMVGDGGGGIGGGIGGSGLGPLSLVAGAKKLFQDVSGDALNGIPAFLHNANVLIGRTLPHDCTTTNGRPDGNSEGAHDISRTSPSLITPHITGECWVVEL